MDSHSVRIIAIRVRPVCIAFSCIYGLVGLLSFIQYCFLKQMQQFTFPIGIFAPFLYLTFNLNIERSITASAPVVFAIAAVCAYAFSGGVTGLVGTCLFNVTIRKMGGIDARFVKAADDPPNPAPTSSQSVR